LVALGSGAALAVALPAALLAQVLEAVRDDGEGPNGLSYAMAVVVLAGMAVGGWVVGTRAPQAPVLLGAAVGLGAIAVILALGIARRSMSGEDVAWRTVPVTASLAIALAATGSVLGARQAARTRG
jgi:putative membrane protein (TIGR04086 family)